MQQMKVALEHRLPQLVLYGSMSQHYKEKIALGKETVTMRLTALKLRRVVELANLGIGSVCDDTYCALALTYDVLPMGTFVAMFAGLRWAVKGG